MEASVTEIVFLDRDGTINVDYGYVTNPEQVELLPGAALAIARLKLAGFAIVIVTNQSAVGRGMATIEDVDNTNKYLQQLLLECNSNARIDIVCVAPDHPDHATTRRKPGVGMLDDVSRSYRFDISRCWVVGDKLTDVYFGKNAGIPPSQCLLITSEQESECGTYETVDSLYDAAEIIISRKEKSKPLS